MAWNLNTLFAFYQNQQTNPAEYNRLVTADPAGRMVSAYLVAEQTYKDSLMEHHALGVGDNSIDPARSTELEAAMTSSLATRTTMLAGLEAVVSLVADYPEPTKRYFESLIVGMRRGRGSAQDIAAVQGVINALDAIVAGCFV